MSQSVSILSPIPDVTSSGRHVVPSLPSLKGRVLGFRIQWSNFDLLVNHLEQKLLDAGELQGTRRLDVVREHRIEKGLADWGACRERELAEFASEVDAAIVGLAA